MFFFLLLNCINLRSKFHIFSYGSKLNKRTKNSVSNRSAKIKEKFTRMYLTSFFEDMLIFASFLRG